MKINLLLLLAIFVSSCVTSKPFEDAQLVGEGNSAIEGTLSRAVFSSAPNRRSIASLVEQGDVGTFGVDYIYGAAENVDVSVGIDLPVGIHGKVKYVMNKEALQHLHGISFETRVPLYYLVRNSPSFIRLSVIPSYIYTYRYDDLFSFSANTFVNTSITESGYFVMPGLTAGISLGDEIKFRAGANYSRTVIASGDVRFQYLTIESSVRYEF